MSLHLQRSICVGYNPAMDQKWRPANMAARKFYPVYAYENVSTVTKPKDGKPSEKIDLTYYHFIGSDGARCRLSAGNAVVYIGETMGEPGKEDQDLYWRALEKSLTQSLSGSESPANDLPF